MAQTGVHTRRPGEYVRPLAALDLTAYCALGDAYLAAGTSFHQESLGRFRDGERVVVEMVPEPFNAFDGWAVALDIDALRVGYLQARSARLWHDVVRSCNRAGLAVTVKGTTRHTNWEDEDDTASAVVLEIRTPRWLDIHDLAHAVGLRGQHDAVMAAVAPALREEMMANAWDGLEGRTAKELRRHRAGAPDLTWVHHSGLEPSDCVPYWHLAFLRHDVLEQRRYAAAIRQLKRHLRRELKRREKQTRADEVEEQKRKRRAASVEAVQLQALGLTHAEISAALGMPVGAVPGLLAAGRRLAPDRAIDWHSREQFQRISRAREALMLQRTGMSRAAIAQAMEASLEVVKELLADARFYEGPSVNPDRLALAFRCHELRGCGLVKAAVLDALGATRAAGLRAYRDASALNLLGLLPTEARDPAVPSAFV